MKKLVLFFVLFLSFIIDTKALQSEPISVQFLDNYGSSLVPVSTELVDGTYYGYFGLTAGSTGGAVAIRLNENIAENHMYSLTVNVGVPSSGYTTTSSKNVIGIGNSIDNAINSYINANDSVVNYTQIGTADAPYYLNLIFSSYSYGAYIIVPYNIQYTCVGSCENFFKGYTLSDLGSIDNLSDDEVNNIINNQTSIIQNDINNMQQSVIGSIDNMEQAIIDSNKETQEVIKDQFNSCRPSNNILNFVNTETNVSGVNVITKDGVLTLSGTATNYGLVNLGTYTLEAGSYYQRARGSEGSTSTSLIRNVANGQVIRAGDGVFTLSETTTITFQIYFNEKFNGTYTYKPMVNVGSSYMSWEAGGEICTNKIDETNSQLGDLNNSLNNSDTTDATNSASNFFSGFQTDTFGLTSIITAPLTLIGNITSSSCSPVGLPLPYVDKTLNLPCLTSIYQQYFGSVLTIYQTITFGIVAYWVCIRIFALVKDFKNPDHDEIEVLDL